MSAAYCVVSTYFGRILCCSYLCLPHCVVSTYVCRILCCFTYGMSAAYCVSGILEIAGEAGRVKALDQVHTLAVKGLKETGVYNVI